MTTSKAGGNGGFGIKPIRNEGEELLILLEMMKLRFKYQITEQEFKHNIKIMYKKQTKKEKEMLEKCYEDIWKRTKQ